MIHHPCPLPGDQLHGGTVIASSHGRDDGGPDDFYVVLLLVTEPPYFGACQIRPDYTLCSDVVPRWNIGRAVEAYADMGGDTEGPVQTHDQEGGA